LDYRPFPGDDGFTHSAFVADRTINFLNSQSQDSPFLCVAGFYSPHAPWVVPQRFLDLYNPDDFLLPAFPPEMEDQRTQDWCSDAHLRRARHGYYAMVSEVDRYIGEIIDALETNRLSENTVVIFTSDHGEWLGEHLRFGKGYPGHDPVTRVPLILFGPALSAGQTINHLVEAVDVLPTILELAGVQVPYQVQGRSFNSLLSGNGPSGTNHPRSYQPRHSALTEHKGWKSIRTHGYRYLINEDGRESLWDLEGDLGSYSDLAGDDRFQHLLAEHRHRLLQRLLEMERPIPRTWPY
jgi:arylsulfatase A-like enzyme